MSADKIKKQFGRYLAEARQTQGMTQADVAKKLGYSSAQYISNWERGAAAPPTSQLAKICEILGLKQRAFIAEYSNVLQAYTNEQIKELRASF